MEKIKCLLIEDEVPAMEELKFLLSKYKDFEVVAEAYNINDAIKNITEHDFDVAFLDINIPGGSGMELCNLIKDKNSAIIFTTAYDEYAIQAFCHRALDYILKPIDEERFKDTIERIRDFKQKQKNDYFDKKIENTVKSILNKHDKKIPCEKNEKILLINLDEIVFFYIEGEETFVKTNTDKYITKFTLNELELKTDFLRTHRSFLVNPNKVKEIHPWFNGTYKLIMDDVQKSEVPVSRSKTKIIKEFYNL